MEMTSEYFKVLELLKSDQHQSHHNSLDYKMNQPRLDHLINCLLRGFWDYEYLKSEIDDLCLATCGVLMKEPSLLELNAPIKISGNFDGQFNTLMSVFEHDGLPPQSNYLFLGNYSDRHGSSLLVTLLLFALKIKYPDKVFLLRGNYDGVFLPHLLVDEVQLATFVCEEIVNECLKYLPVAALINDKIICTHGGLSPDLHNLDQIRHISRPTQIPKSGLLRDLLGHDPTMHRHMVKHDINTFASKKIQKFLLKHDLRLIFCDDQIVGGYKASASQRIATICSASKQSACGMIEFDHVGAMTSVDVNLKYSFHILKPKEGDVDYTFMASMTGKSETSPRNSPPPSASKPATKYRSIFTGFKLTNWTSKANSGNSASTSEPESSQGVNHPVIKSATNHRYASPDLVKRAERATFVSNTPTTARTTKYRSDSPELKIVRNHGSVRGAESESEPRTFPPDFDPANMYRSKSPGVKRFIGAKV